MKQRLSITTVSHGYVYLFEFALVGIEPKNGNRLHQIAEQHEIVLHLHLQTIDMSEILRQLDEFVILRREFIQANLNLIERSLDVCTSSTY